MEGVPMKSGDQNERVTRKAGDANSGGGGNAVRLLKGVGNKAGRRKKGGGGEAVR